MATTKTAKQLKINTMTKAQYDSITPVDDELYLIPDAPFFGTDGEIDGTAGLVPAPTAADAGKFLKADGTWADIQATIDALEARIAALEG